MDNLIYSPVLGFWTVDTTKYRFNKAVARFTRFITMWTPMLAVGLITSTAMYV